MVAERGQAQMTGKEPVSENAVGSRRAAWRITAGVGASGEAEGNEQEATHEKEYVTKVGGKCGAKTGLEERAKNRKEKEDWDAAAARKN